MSTEAVLAERAGSVGWMLTVMRGSRWQTKDRMAVDGYSPLEVLARAMS